MKPTPSAAQYNSERIDKYNGRLDAIPVMQHYKYIDNRSCLLQNDRNNVVSRAKPESNKRV